LTPVIELRGIRQAYGDHLVVDGLSLTLAKGSIGCLLGPSGCGKTTVLRCIAGFERIQSGEILINGQTVSTPTLNVPTEQRRVGIVFQDYALFPHLNVERNVAFGLHRLPAEERRARVERMLAVTGLEGLAQRYPHELSGGQQQRVALARALALAPDVLLLDEPTASLDPHAKREVERFMAGIAQSGVTLVFASHNLGQVKRLATRVVYLEHGRILADLPVRDFFDGPLGKTSREAELFVRGELG
jgi:iron(III) transport system ATP-binding protein